MYFDNPGGWPRKRRGREYLYGSAEPRRRGEPFGLPHFL